MNRICIIDSGYDAESIHIDEKLITETITIKRDDDNYIISSGAKDVLGHGTAVLSIIQRDSPTDTVYQIIKIFESELSCGEDMLLFVLEYVYEHIVCDYINLSLGVTLCKERARLIDICDKLCEKGVIIVSAFDNDGAVSYPAALPGVIGVDSDEICKTKKDIAYVEDSMVNVFAYGRVQRISKTFSKYMYISGTSVACAHVTGLLASLGVKTLKKALASLSHIAAFTFYKSDNRVGQKNGSIVSSIKKAIVFPYNKEMHSLVKFDYLLPFSIEGVFDTSKTGLVGRKIDTYRGDGQYTIANWKDIEWEADFDTVVIGHTEDYNRITDEDWLKKTLELCSKYNKKVYCFDEDPDVAQSSPNVTIEWPHKDFLQDKFGKLYEIGAPVLGIFGTGSKQGKYTLQLILREFFLNKGYKLGQIGSEPSAMLFGMDDVFHFGFNRKFKLSGPEFIEALNDSLNKIQNRGVDIIMAGSQSGTVPYDPVNLKYLTTRQMDFLLGLNPDYVLLCINFFDELNYIKRTIMLIESLGDCKVIAAVLFPMTYSGEYAVLGTPSKRASYEEIIEKKKTVNKMCKIPCFELGEKGDMEKLFTCIINSFTR
jgi:hypothetical protein